MSFARSHEISELKDRIARLLSSNPSSPYLQLCRDQLDSLLSLYNRGVFIRSKVKDFKFDDRPSRYLFNKETAKSAKKLFTSLTVNGSTVSDLPSTMSVRDFYSGLFSDEPVSDTHIDFLLDNLPSLSAAESASLEGPLTFEEVRAALRAMKDYSSPGPDALPKVFYLSFLDHIGPLYVSLVNQCFEDVLLCDSQRLSYISLLCKDHTKSDNLKFWRPISLLNLDYKTISKVLFTRLGGVMLFCARTFYS